ncbi:hypothetical protein [Cysteiniphilum litorale]|uniref:hypothetical protein n=1 Tax=Cysteiniphilum litorale TaxID=2056700 RepID=UPI003F881D76
MAIKKIKYKDFLGLWAVVSGALLASACSSVTHMQKETLAGFTTGKYSITPVIPEKPAREALVFQPTQAFIPFAGLYMPKLKGDELIAKDNLISPGEIALPLLLAQLKAGNSRVQFNGIYRYKLNKDGKPMLETRESDYILEVLPGAWVLGYHPLIWTHYTLRVALSANLREQSTGKTLWSDGCNYADERSAIDEPTFDAYTDDHSALLKKEITQAVANCVRNLKKSFYQTA